MSEAVSSNHDPDSRLPEATQPEEIPGEQEDRTSQPTDSVASGELLQGAIRETIPLGVEDWQPVKFPDTVSLAEIAQSVASVSESTQSSALNPRESQSDVRKRVDHLQQENSVFRDQITQLERDLAQAQVELQLEVTRFYCKESEAAAIPQSKSFMGIVPQSPPNPQDLSSIHQQISQLSQELDSSQKMGHRQQILVETLSEQLQSSQERIAHLERDCAITQQRYNEQVQLVLQAENVCRDLRMRLHRQQRQALQFKAALEKSLEMESVQGTAIAHSDLSSPSAIDSVAPFIPKVQSVQPWSQVATTATQESVNCRSDGTVFPKLLAKLLPSDQQLTEVETTPIHEVELPSFQTPLSVNEADQSIAEVIPASASPVEAEFTLPEVVTPEDVSQYMSLIFPKQADSNSQTPAAASLPQESVFDLSPFLESDEADVSNVSTVELRPIAKQILPPLLHPPRPKKSVAHPQTRQAADSTPQALSKAGDREDNLWADLAKLIQPDSTVESTSTLELSDVTVGRSPIQSNPFQPAANLIRDERVPNEKTAEAENKGDRPPTAKPLSLDFFAYIEKKATPAQNIPAQNTDVLNFAPDFAPDSAPDANMKLSQVEKKAVAPRETLEQTEPSRSQTSNKSNTCPSPILYPFRPTKKLKSMSAVDLPSFRQAAN